MGVLLLVVTGCTTQLTSVSTSAATDPAVHSTAPGGPRRVQAPPLSSSSASRTYHARPPAASAAAVSAWVTTSDQSQLMTQIPVTSTVMTSSPPADITINFGYTAQPIDGFGAALTHSSAQVLLGLPAAQRAALMTELFDPAGPVRLTFLRIRSEPQILCPDRHSPSTTCPPARPIST